MAERTEQQRRLITTHMTLIARHCVSTCQFRKTTPTALQLYVDQEPSGPWRIRSASDPTETTLPAGSGILAWDTSQYPDVDRAFQAVLAQAWQELHAE